VGKNELDAGNVALKDMKTGEQVLVTVEEVLRILS
jgi:histidyl-tRNA synthetase